MRGRREKKKEEEEEKKGERGEVVMGQGTGDREEDKTEAEIFSLSYSPSVRGDILSLLSYFVC